MISLLFTLVFLASNAVAAPTADGTITPAGYCPVTEHHVARFDNLPFWDKTYNAIPKYYGDLNFWDFQVHRDNGFIRAVSGDQTAVAYGGSGSISTLDYAYKQTFDLHKLFYACSAWLPQKECTINVSGVKLDGSIVRRDLIFPALWEGIQATEYYMNVTEFGTEWEDLKRVDFNVTGMYAGVLLDDVEYSIRTAC